jgi:hypothetical protein
VVSDARPLAGLGLGCSRDVAAALSNMRAFATNSSVESESEREREREREPDLVSFQTSRCINQRPERL